MDVTALSSVGSLGATRPGVAAPSPAASATGPSFADMLGQIINAGVNTIQGMTGAAPPFKVVEAVMDAQRTLQEGLAIRDKVVSAYQEIARMAI